MSCLQSFKEQPTEQKRKHRNRQEEAWSAGDPALTISRQRATGNKAVDVRMMGERLPLGVENGDEAELAAEMPWVCSNGLERRGHGIE